MSHRWSTSELAYELVKRRLPLSYVRRVLGEISDHESDAAECVARVDGEEGRENAAGGLGNSAQLADQLATAFRSQRFSGRHQLASFLLAPIVMLVIAWVASYLAVAAGVEYVFPLESISDAAANSAVQAIFGLEFLVVPACVALLLSAQVQRCGLSRWWAVLSTALVALLLFNLYYEIHPRTGGEMGTGTLIIGLPLLSLQQFPALGQIIQFAVPVVTVGMFWACDHYRSKRFLGNLGDWRQSPQDVAA